jgi:hypothetical protein
MHSCPCSIWCGAKKRTGRACKYDTRIVWVCQIAVATLRVWNIIVT